MMIDIHMHETMHFLSQTIRYDLFFMVRQKESEKMVFPPGRTLENQKNRQQTARGKNDWLANKNLAQCSLNKEGILILGIHRDDGSYLGVPRGETQIYPGDTLVLYGREKTIYSLGKRSKDSDGETVHHQAVDEQNREKAAQVRQEKNYAQKRSNRNR
jgi:hypothetical protein